MIVVARPTKAKLFGHDIKITWDKSLRGRDLFGEANRYKMLVRVSPDASSSQQKATVLHELLHLMWTISGMNQRLRGAFTIPRDNGFMEFLEEEVVRSYENAIFAMIKDNPRLFDWIKSQ